MKHTILKYTYHTILAILGLILSVTTLLFIFLKSTIIYSIFIQYTGLSKTIQVSNDVLNLNYKVLISYLTNPMNAKLTFPNFPMSNSASVHFMEVKQIFMILLALGILGAIIIFIHIAINKKKATPSKLLFLSIMPIISFIISIIILLACTIDFEDAFIIFHKILFKNNYWIFNPITDPIIDALPENFFLLAGLFIVIPLLIESLILLFRFTLPRKQS